MNPSDKDIARFWKKIARGGECDCWPWTAGARNQVKRGMRYGCIGIQGRVYFAHRVAYELTHGDPGVLCVCHKCDNTLCCNPAHLFLGTKGDNNRDRARKGRSADMRGDKHWTASRPECSARGSGHGMAKLDETRVREIRAKLAAGQHSKNQLAREFGISKRAVQFIATRRTWAHI